jgi:non-specific protein-tyrosine kinase
MDLGPGKIPADLPIDVEVSRTPTRETGGPAFSLTKIAPRVPTAKVAPDPLLLGPAPRAFKEGYRELRYNLERMRERSGVRTVGVVSVADGDGKSLTATNLALTMTEGGRRRVALIDACFGKARIATLLGAEAPIGLAEVLAGKVPVEQAMFACEQPGLFAMASGSVHATGLDPLDVAETFATLCNRLATVFDYVIVDTPAMGDAVDAAAFASRLDGVVLVVKAGKTKASDIDQAIAKLGENRVLGLVLNKV